jgi:DNA-binding transcriptional ArsR family regulator
VEALAREAGLGVSTASAHLQVLRMASLVTTRRALESRAARRALS